MQIFKKIVPAVCLMACSVGSAFAFGPWTAPDSVTRAEVDPVMLSLDSMAFQLFTRDKFFATTDELQRLVKLSKEELPTFSEEEIKAKMKLIPSIIPLDYNSDVKAFIDMFVYRKRDLMTKLLANSQIYFPLFEEALDKKKMPDELKYLPVIESALNPLAVSSAGATGLWQMMLGTGKMMGLDANSYIDERRDPIKSTQAGTKYLQQLHDLYGDWQLALAAYNSGPGYVNKAIARSGGVKNFWAIKNFLPAETRSYVPTYIAIVYAMNYAKDYKLESAEPKRELYAVDTIMIPAKVTLGHVARTVGISEAELQFLNPSLKLGVIPQVAGGFPLNLPVNYFATFEAKKETILNDPEIVLQASGSEQYAQPTMVRVPRYVWYKVRRSDNIGGIAARYGVTISEIKKWNHLRSSTVARGQSLKILTFPEVPVYQNTTTAAKATPATKAEPSSEVQTSSNAVSTDTQEGKEEVLYYYEEGKDPKKVPAPASTNVATQQAYSTAVIKKPNVQYYRVQNGDTLWSIVQRYPGLSINKLRTDNRLTGRSTILKGQVLKIVL